MILFNNHSFVMSMGANSKYYDGLSGSTSMMYDAVLSIFRYSFLSSFNYYPLSLMFLLLLISTTIFTLAILAFLIYTKYPFSFSKVFTIRF